MSLILGFALPAHAQQGRMVSGTVVYEDGEPIIGATIKVDGTTSGTFTDVDGKFSISVPAKGSITISYLGFASQTLTDFSNTHIIMKEDALKLDDVIVVGYGVQKKAHLTGAISTTEMSDITDLTTGDLSSALRGLMNGVNVDAGSNRPGGTSRVTIRNNKDVSGEGSGLETDPLYVIDGYSYPYAEGAIAFNNLDATMIESISVLKDASAAVYGSRAANGVVLVTTKKGQIGKPKISYSGQFGYADEVSRPKMLSAYEYGKIWNGMRAANPNNVPNPLTELYQADELEAMRGMNYDLLDDEWSAAFTQKHSINLGGGTENANYYAGVSYYTQDGNMGNIDYERWNYRAGLDLKINKWLKASMQVSGNYGEQNSSYSSSDVGSSNAETDYSVLLTRPRHIPAYVNGKPMAAYSINNNEANTVQNFHYNTIQELNNYKKSMTQETTINTSLEYDFGWNEYLKGLKLKFSYAKSINTNKGNAYGSNYSLYALNTRGGSGNHLYTTDDVSMDDSNFREITIINGNMISRSMYRTDNYQMNFIATYQRKFGHHDISGLFSVEKSEREQETLDGAMTAPYPSTTGQSGSASGSPSTAFDRYESGTLSYIGRINYAYMDKYLVEFLIRSDASTKFAPENYWGTFPSLSLGWVMSQEDWFREKVKGIDYLKLRTSFGLTGRDNIKAWTWANFYSYRQDGGPVFGNNNTTSSYIRLPDASYNRDAVWDKSYKANLGVDFAVLNRRLSINLDGYYEWNRDVFKPRNGDIPSTVGSATADENFASFDDYGFEIGLGWKDKIGKDFKYGVRVNTGYSDNKVNKYPWETQLEFDDYFPGERRDRGLWGLECMGIFRSYQEIEEYFAKYNITNYLGKNKSDIHPGMLIYKDVRGKNNGDGTWEQTPDGIIDKDADRVKISSRSNNIYSLSMNLNAEWKSFSLSAQIGASWGGYSVLSKNVRSVYNNLLNTSGYNSMQWTNMPSFWADNMFVYEDVLDASGNVVAEANRNAKYPNLMFDDINSLTSTFWKISNTQAKYMTKIS
ncbi:TonB-dependent receptor [Dysgonomonas sp. 511]|uniref:SusC/RagA family TonB-linked outer membrane protein n=1 Tax=Dysgonomonas sp. 511 TaxID=2302930 RepID=UPI0013D5F636|nr:TonB-dependent receptor [Dysgonomonas sp. 511]